MTVRYDDDIIIAGGSATPGEGAQNLLPTKGRVLCQVADIKKEQRLKFGTVDVYEDCLRLVYEAADTPANRRKEFVGKTVDERVGMTRNLSNERATLHHRYRAATGTTPQPGVNYPIRRDMLGRYVWVQLGERVSSTGSVWPKVAGVTELEDDDYADNGLDAPAAPRAKAEDLYPPQPAAPAPRKPVVTATATRRGAPPPDDDEDEDEDD